MERRRSGFYLLRGERLVRSRRDRDRCGRIGRREGGAPLRAPRGLDPRHPRAGRPRLDAFTRRPRTGPGLVAPIDVASLENAADELLRTTVEAVAGEQRRPGRARARGVAGRPRDRGQRQGRGAHRRRPARPRAGAVDRPRVGQQLRRAARDLPRPRRTHASMSSASSRCLGQRRRIAYTDRMDLGLLETTMARARRARVPRPAGVGVGRAGCDRLRSDDERAGAAARRARARRCRSRRSRWPASRRRGTAP